MEWLRHVVSTSEIRNTYEIFLTKPEGKRQLQTLGED
jgi:hypothetical protein